MIVRGRKHARTATKDGKQNNSYRRCHCVDDSLGFLRLGHTMLWVTMKFVSTIIALLVLASKESATADGATMGTTGRTANKAPLPAFLSNKNNGKKYLNHPFTYSSASNPDGCCILTTLQETNKRRMRSLLLSVPSNDHQTTRLQIDDSNDSDDYHPTLTNIEERNGLLTNLSSRRRFMWLTTAAAVGSSSCSIAQASDMNSALMPSLPQATPLPQVLPDTSGIGMSTSRSSTTLPSTQNKSPPPAICDPTVAILEKSIEGEKRRIYILGTAHISESSAQLAGDLVSQTMPDAVFVELDAKRVGRIQKQPDATLSSQAQSFSSSQIRQTQQQQQAFLRTFDHQLTLSAALILVEGFIQNPITALQNRFQSSLQELVGNSIKQLYQSLEKEGFSAGEEFVVAVRQGLAQNATIILGDQDVDITLRRLTEALQKTDLQKLLTNPELNDANLFDGSGGGSGLEGGDGIKIDVAKGGKLDITADQLKVYVETLKTQENVRQLMKSFKESAPYIYQAMVEERDMYMASGLNRLGSMTQAQVDEASKSAIVLSSSDVTQEASAATQSKADLASNMPYKTIVAVMGLAHLDGVRGFLIQQGEWKEVSKPAICR